MDDPEEQKHALVRKEAHLNNFEVNGLEAQ
jgi:hypothetical protein